MTTIERWLAAAEADARARGLAELTPLLPGMAAATAVLRAAPWNERADAPAGPRDGAREDARS
jgi:hypothetical protein